MKLEKNVPIPDGAKFQASNALCKGTGQFGRVGSRGPDLKYPFRLMEIGDSLLFGPGKEAKRAWSAAASTHNRHTDLRFSKRTDPATGEVRIWRVA